MIEIFYFFDESLLDKLSDLQIWKIIFLGAFSHFTYNAFSYSLLKKVSSLSHNILSGMKRLIVIFDSIFYFGTSTSVLNLVSYTMTISGLLLYGYERNISFV